VKYPTLVFEREHDGLQELVVNFGVYSGREPTDAEIYRLARLLLEEIDSVEIISERRYEFGAEVEATVHTVRIVVPARYDGRQGELLPLVSDWAHDSIGERRHMTP
jgi:hypothetical protein